MFWRKTLFVRLSYKLHCFWKTFTLFFRGGHRRVGPILVVPSSFGQTAFESFLDSFHLFLQMPDLFPEFENYSKNCLAQNLFSDDRYFWQQCFFRPRCIWVVGLAPMLFVPQSFGQTGFQNLFFLFMNLWSSSF